MDNETLACPAAARDEPSPLFVALELSRASWVIGIQGPGARRPSLHRRPAGDAAGVVDLVERHRRKDATAPPIPVLCCYEIGYDGFWLSRYLAAHGIAVVVVDPASMQVSRRARRAKTDKVDVGALLRGLIAYHGGDRHVWREVRVPTVAEEDGKRLHRERRTLLKEKNQHINRIKGLCAQQGIYDFEPARANRHERLAVLRTGDGRPLPDQLRRQIAREISRLELTLEMMKEVEHERDARIANRDTKATQMIVQLSKLRGVGAQIATVLVHETFYRSFSNRRELAAYAGLAPSPYMSGGMRQDHGLNKAGNPLLRTTMVELAWLWLRYQPESGLSQWFKVRVDETSARMKRIMIVALARKLLVALWRYLELGLVPASAQLKG
jgi:transposase